MRLVPPSLQALVAELGKLPGVGQRTALRFAVALIQSGPQRSLALQHALTEIDTQVGHCPTCHFWSQEGVCPICTDAQRVEPCLCVVRDCPDVLALEKNRTHSWRYHVLQGLLSPLMGRGPAQIRLESLFKRLDDGVHRELILALDATVEGDATALYIRDQLKERYPNVKLSRTALGLPAGSSVEYLDASTLESALSHRTLFE